MAHLLFNHHSYKQEEHRSPSSTTSSPKRARNSSFVDDTMSIAPPTPLKRISTSSRREMRSTDCPSPVSVVAEMESETDLIQECVVSENQEQARGLSQKAIQFSTVVVHTHAIEYAPDFVEKSYPWMLGWTKVETKSYKTVEEHQQDEYLVKKKKNRRATMLGMIPFKQQQQQQKRLQRTSAKTRKNRLLEMGYTNAELDLLELQREVNDLTMKSQMNHQAKLHFQNKNLFSLSKSNRNATSPPRQQQLAERRATKGIRSQKMIQKYAYDYPPSLFQVNPTSSKQQVFLPPAPYLMI